MIFNETEERRAGGRQVLFINNEVELPEPCLWWSGLRCVQVNDKRMTTVTTDRFQRIQDRLSGTLPEDVGNVLQVINTLCLIRPMHGD